MPGYHLYVGQPDSEGFPSGEWTDEIVAHTVRRKKDGSITILAVVNVYGDDGKLWGRDDVVIRLPRKRQRLKMCCGP